MLGLNNVDPVGGGADYAGGNLMGGEYGRDTKQFQTGGK